ncbi:MAG: type II toxin-antitoxin system RelE/ParE family toxin [Akkermansiaceae bacterium]|nr:type II toxin-antitoxin system RelE/ParE family toxin [Armatimonadota bacterium]
MIGADEPANYSVRVTERANRDIDAIYVYFAEEFGEAMANKWRGGIIKAITGLSFMPERYALVPKRHFRMAVRHYTWRRSGSSLTHRILYVAEMDGQDGPAVRVIHIRGASRAPITAEDAREIEAQQ